MGCDIHAFVEYSDRKNSEFSYWSEFADLQLSRRYEYFAAIAGVRNTSETRPLVEPRGIPEDCKVDLEHWLHEDDGLHHHGYLSYEEVCSAFEHAKIDLDKLNPDWMAMLSAMKVLSQTKIVRIVFAFDN